jgi:Spy/CpxP family protein refolding chaperone
MKRTMISRMMGIALVAGLLFATSTDALAQRGPQDVDRMLDRMQERLELSDEQAQQVRSMMEAHRAERAELMQRLGNDRANWRNNEELADMRQRHQAQMESILTPEQVEKHRAMRGQMMQRSDRPGRGMRGAQGPGANIERMQQRLNLTDDQVAQMRALMAEHRENRQQSQAEFREQMAEILTDEQRAQMQQMRNERPQRGERGQRQMRQPRNR